MNDPIHIISLGAGVQSSTMALMAAHGEITPMPVAAIFADTQAEPASVYRWLDWLEKQLPFPTLRVSKGDLTRDMLRVRSKKDGSGTWAMTGIPFYIANADGTRGVVQRQCTYDYKVMQLNKAARVSMKQHDVKCSVQWIGISLDEAHRMKPSRERNIECRWPLIEKRMKRYHCLQWMEDKGYPKPPRSACVYCPYHSDTEWRRLRDEEPDEFVKAVQFEKDVQEVKRITGNMKGVPFLHKSCVPLDQVDFSTDVERGQGLLFGNECEGMCGV